MHAVLRQQHATAAADDAFAAPRSEGKHGVGGKRDGAALGVMEDMTEHGATLRRAPLPRS
ncbi:MAG TPA: hypothetical protein VN028_01845 [Rhodocyclaceae bacterium]|nr:hypothetical protein [Rhodocyclaceae bacterium]